MPCLNWKSGMWDGICPDCTDRDQPEVEWRGAECAGLTHRVLRLQVAWNKSGVDAEGRLQARSDLTEVGEDCCSGKMKFAEHLSSHITPEWRKQYLQYEVNTCLLRFGIKWGWIGACAKLFSGRRSNWIINIEKFFFQIFVFIIFSFSFSPESKRWKRGRMPYCLWRGNDCGCWSHRDHLTCFIAFCWVYKICNWTIGWLPHWSN